MSSGSQHDENQENKDNFQSSYEDQHKNSFLNNTDMSISPILQIPLEFMQFEEENDFIINNIDLVGPTTKTLQKDALEPQKEITHYDNQKENLELICSDKSYQGIVPRNSLYFRRAQTKTLDNISARLKNSVNNLQNYTDAVKTFNFGFDLDANPKIEASKENYYMYCSNFQFKQMSANHKANRNSLPVIKSIISILSDFVQALLALTSVTIYILNSYSHSSSEDEETSTETEYDYIFFIEFCITLVGTLDYGKEIWEAKRKLRHIFKISTIVDFITIVPFYLSFIVDTTHHLSFLHILQTFKILRILRLWRIFREPSWDKSDSEVLSTNILDTRYSLIRQIGVFCFSLGAVVFIGAGFFKEFDAIFHHTYLKYADTSHSEDIYISTLMAYSSSFKYFDGVYLMCQTLLTAGVGDIIPIALSSRMLLVVFLVTLFLVMYYQGNKIKEIAMRLSYYDFRYREKNHIVILGDFDEYSVYKFLYEAYNSSEIFTDSKKTLIISQKEPSELMISILNNRMFEGKVAYQINNMAPTELFLKARLPAARAIYIFNKHLQFDDVEKVDGETMLIAKVIHEKIPFVRKIIQMNDFSNAKELFKQLNHFPFTTVYSTHFLKTKILTKSVFIQGITTIMGNFICNHQTSPAFLNMNKIFWYLEYSKSFDQELFCVKISAFFYGMNFAEVSKKLFCSKSQALSSQGILLLGVKSYSLATEKGIVYLNPYNYKIKSGDYGIVLAHSVEDAEFLSDYSEKVDLTLSFMHSPIEKKILRSNPLTLINEFKNAIIKENEFYCNITDITRPFKLWKDDLNGRISNHIILICPETYIESCAQTIRQRSAKPIVYLSDTNPTKVWWRTSSLFPNIIYCECDFFDIEQIYRSAIRDAFHVLIFSTIDKSSISPDSNTLMIVNTIDCFFEIPYTLEIFDEDQIRFLGNKPQGLLQELPYQFWPRYVSGKVFLSSLLDSMCALIYLNDVAIEVFENLLGERNKPFWKSGKPHNYVLEVNENTFEKEFYQNLEKIEEQSFDNITEVLQNQEIYKIPIPKSYVGLSWLDLMNDLMDLKPQVIPIALCTNRFCNKSEGNELKNSNFQDYVTNDLHKEEPITNKLLGFVKKDLLYLNEDEKKITQMQYLDTELTITNPLPTTVLYNGDSMIILGMIVDRKKLKNKEENDLAKQKSLFHKTEAYIKVLLQQKASRGLAQISETNEKDRKTKFEFIKYCLKNLKKRVDPSVRYDEKIYQKQMYLESLQFKIDGLKNDMREIDNKDFYGNSPSSSDHGGRIDSKPNEKVKDIIQQIAEENSSEDEDSNKSKESESSEENDISANNLVLLQQLHPDLLKHHLSTQTR